MNYFKSAGCFSLMYLFVYICLTFVAAMIIPSPNLSSTLIYIGFLIFTFAYLAICKNDIKTTLRLHKLRPAIIGLLILITMTAIPFVSFVNYVSQLFVHDLTTKAVTRSIFESSAFSLISVALMPAIAEEIIFRGVIFSKLRGARPVKGILLTACFFGLAHMNFNQITYAFFFGILLGLVVEITDSIFASIIMHFLFNANSIVSTFLFSKIKAPSYMLETSSQATLQGCFYLLPYAIGSLVLSGLLLYAIAILSGRLGYIKTWFKKDIRQRLPKDSVTNISFYVAMAICLLFSLLVELSTSQL